MKLLDRSPLSGFQSKKDNGLTVFDLLFVTLVYAKITNQTDLPWMIIIIPLLLAFTVVIIEMVTNYYHAKG